MTDAANTPADLTVPVPSDSEAPAAGEIPGAAAAPTAADVPPETVAAVSSSPIPDAAPVVADTVDAPPETDEKPEMPETADTADTAAPAPAPVVDVSQLSHPKGIDPFMTIHESEDGSVYLRAAQLGAGVIAKSEVGICFIPGARVQTNSNGNNSIA